MTDLQAHYDRTGLTDERFAELVGLDRTFVCKVRNGKARPSLEAALRIYDATRLKLGVLAGAPKRDIEAWRRLVQRQKAEAA